MAEVIVLTAMAGLCVGVASSSAVAYFEDKPTARVVDAPPEARPAPEEAAADEVPVEEAPDDEPAPAREEEEEEAPPAAEDGVPEEKTAERPPQKQARRSSLITKFLPQRMSKGNVRQ